MLKQAASADALVIGGGFYGAVIALYLARERKFDRVILAERADALLTRASHTNQARVHNGYHYPRSFTTAYRSRINLPRFVSDWPDAVHKNFTKLYAIARRNSKVTARQFERFCREIGAPLEPAAARERALFDQRLIEQVFEVQEYAFDATVLAAWAWRELALAGVQVRLSTTITALAAGPEGTLDATAQRAGADAEQLNCAYVFNCSYSGLNQLGGAFPGTRTGLKHELTEMALMAMPPELAGLGITVMDGPFFSLMPFPSRALHTLSHVRYTPHLSWIDAHGIDPYRRLDDYERDSRVERMLRDVGRYVPAVLRAEYRESLFEIKTVLIKNEGDDGRPILFEKHEALPGCYSILGGKLDNMYDALEQLGAERF